MVIIQNSYLSQLFTVAKELSKYSSRQDMYTKYIFLFGIKS